MMGIRRGYFRHVDYFFFLLASLVMTDASSLVVHMLSLFVFPVPYATLFVLCNENSHLSGSRLVPFT